MFDLKFPFFAMVILVTMESCTSPRLLLHQDLREQADCYPVQGRLSFTWRPRLAFGTYATTYIRRGVLRSYQWSVWIRTRGASQRMKIILAHPGTGTFDTIQTTARMKQRDLPLWNGRIALPLSYRNLLTGEIHSGPESPVIFALYPTDNPWSSIERCGHMEIPGEPLLEIFRHDALEGGREFPLAGGLGYRLVQNRKTIAQITVINRGEVCISKDLDPRLEHRIASLFSVILLMQDLN